MPRANRYTVAGRTYHLTHRCHDRQFLLKFSKDRDSYRSLLREQLQEFRSVRLLGYCITSNHTHLLVNSEEADGVLGRFMQSLEGQFAQFFNRRKNRQGAFWSDRYHATMIDGGMHLWNCMKYIDLNMVRAGVVKHPEEWAWNGYGELMGLKKRYRVLDLERLVEMLGYQVEGALRTHYQAAVSAELQRGEKLERDAKWTEAVAVGSQSFVEGLSRLIRHRNQIELEECGTGDGTWLIREPGESYRPFSGPENGAKEGRLGFFHA